MRHLAGAFLNKSWKDGNVIKVENVQWDFDQLGWYFHLVLSSRERHGLWVLLLFYYLLGRLRCCSRADCQWPFGLIVSIESLQENYYYET